LVPKAAFKFNLCRYNAELIGQRLFTGRVAVAQGAHEFRRRLFRRTRAHNDAKPCWAPGGGSHSTKKTLMLSSIPQLRALYVVADARWGAAQAS
jgi:acyl-CoA oxidase